MWARPFQVQRADAVLEEGNVKGYAVFKPTVKAAEALLRKERPAGAPLQ